MPLSFFPLLGYLGFHRFVDSKVSSRDCIIYFKMFITCFTENIFLPPYFLLLPHPPLLYSQCSWFVLFHSPLPILPILPCILPFLPFPSFLPSYPSLYPSLPSLPFLPSFLSFLVSFPSFPCFPFFLFSSLLISFPPSFSFLRSLYPSLLLPFPPSFSPSSLPSKYYL